MRHNDHAAVREATTVWCNTPGHDHRLSRRRVLQAGAATAALSVGSGLVGANPAAAGGRGGRHRRPGIPQQVEGFSPLISAEGGPQVPFFLPIEVDPFAGLPAGGPFDPSTIGDFAGVVGLVEADGVTAESSDGTDRRWACDIRVMKGRYRDRQGRRRNGAFTFL